LFGLFNTGLIPKGNKRRGSGLDRGQVTVYTLDAIAQAELGFKGNEDQVLVRRTQKGAGDASKAERWRMH
jgi:hypothetical protein